LTVELAVVPHETQHLIVVGSPVRKPANIVRAWLQSLAWQVRPRNVQLYHLFIDDGCDAEARALLDEFVAQYGGTVGSASSGSGDFSDQGPTHQWTESAMNRVGVIKDQILQFARQNRAEAVWLVDADLILDPMTLTSLWSVPEQIVSAVYWTRWTQPKDDHPPIHAGPQVWLQHPYGLQGMGLEEWEFRHRLIHRQLTEVAGLGACTLIRRDALMRGVAFAPWPGNAMQGIGLGEDRHFCLRAEALHIKLWADPWPDIFHIYHRPDDEELIPEMTFRLMPTTSSIDGVGIVRKPELGDLVSLELHALEPVLTQAGPQYVPTQYVRGRLGQLTLHTELEDAILSMQRGEVGVVPTHFGLDYPFSPYRGQRRLIRITLHDHKPNGYAPVIEDELIVNSAGSAIDTTTMPPETLDLMKEVHA
jgi:hypothetical protein